MWTPCESHRAEIRGLHKRVWFVCDQRIGNATPAFTVANFDRISGCKFVWMYLDSGCTCQKFPQRTQRVTDKVLVDFLGWGPCCPLHLFPQKTVTAASFRPPICATSYHFGLEGFLASIGRRCWYTKSVYAATNSLVVLLDVILCDARMKLSTLGNALAPPARQVITGGMSQLRIDQLLVSISWSDNNLKIAQVLCLHR